MLRRSCSSPRGGCPGTREFFDHLGTIDAALWSGLFAGFTDHFGSSSTNNSMPFLQPTVSKNRFISGLSIAADDDPRATYFPLKSNGTPTTAPAGIAFRGNDWLAFPEGDQYLANVGGTSQLPGDWLHFGKSMWPPSKICWRQSLTIALSCNQPPVQMPELAGVIA